MSIRRSWIACFAVLFVFALLAGSSLLDAQNPNRRVIVVLKNGNRANNVAQRHGLVPGHVYSHALNGFSAVVNDASAKRLENDADVAWVEDDVVYTVNGELTPGVDRMEADLNAVANIDGNDDRVDVDVAVIDSGCDLQHTDLNIHFDKSFIKKKGGKNGDDDNGHGTHVAGTIAALDNGVGVVGVAPGARIWALKVLDNQGSGWTSDIIAAIDFVAANAAEIEVANMSLGGTGTGASMRAAIQNAVANGVVFVVAAGNDSDNVYGSDGQLGTSDDYTPAAFPECLTVSAMHDSDGTAGGAGSSVTYTLSDGSTETVNDDTFGWFSNYSTEVDSSNPVSSPGAAIDLAAPGVNIVSTVPAELSPDGSGYDSYLGTSMAAPHVAGAVALYVVANGRASDAAGVYAIRQALIDTAEAQSNWGTATGDADSNHEGVVQISGAAANAAPAVTISSPADNDIVPSGSTVTFTGSANDAEDGDVTGTLVWNSDIDGAIGTGASFTATLTDGTHTITATATDLTGKSGSSSVSLTVGIPNDAPVVTITDPADGSTIESGASATFSASASDTEDGDLSGNISWSSDLDGALGTGASVTATLSDGTHTITATVTDSGGKSSSDTISVTVANILPMTATVSTDKASYGNRQTVYITTAVTDTNGPVAGATVQVRVVTASGRAMGATVTTDANGEAVVTYKVNSKRDGTGTYNVTSDVTEPNHEATSAATSFEVN